MTPFLQQVKDNWLALGLVVSLIVSWTTMNSRIVQAEGKIAELSEVIQQINEINISVAVIKEKVTSIEKKI